MPVYGGLENPLATFGNCWRADEVAQLLDTTVASTLQRARATLIAPASLIAETTTCLDGERPFPPFGLPTGMTVVTPS